MLSTMVATGLALTALGVAGAMGVQIGVVGYLATALLIVGLGVIVSAWIGRSGGLVTLGVLLLIATCVAAASVGPLKDQAQTFMSPREITYTQLGQLPTAPVHYDSGAYRIDLSTVDVTAARRLNVSVDAGSLTVVVPASARVHVEASADMGQIMIGDQMVAGSDSSITHDLGPEGGATLTLVLHADFGRIQVVTP